MVVCSDPVVGRYMVAARDIEAGEVIFNDEPACIGELSSSTDPGTPSTVYNGRLKL